MRNALQVERRCVSHQPARHRKAARQRQQEDVEAHVMLLLNKFEANRKQREEARFGREDDAEMLD